MSQILDIYKFARAAQNFRAKDPGSFIAAIRTESDLIAKYRTDTPEALLIKDQRIRLLCEIVGGFFHIIPAATWLNGSILRGMEYILEHPIFSGQPAKDLAVSFGAGFEKFIQAEPEAALKQILDHNLDRGMRIRIEPIILRNLDKAIKEVPTQVTMNVLNNLYVNVQKGKDKRKIFATMLHWGAQYQEAYKDYYLNPLFGLAKIKSLSRHERRQAFSLWEEYISRLVTDLKNKPDAALPVKAANEIIHVNSKPADGPYGAIFDMVNEKQKVDGSLHVARRSFNMHSQALAKSDFKKFLELCMSLLMVLQYFPLRNETVQKEVNKFRDDIFDKFMVYGYFKIHFQSRGHSANSMLFEILALSKRPTTRNAAIAAILNSAEVLAVEKRFDRAVDRIMELLGAVVGARSDILQRAITYSMQWGILEPRSAANNLYEIAIKARENNPPIYNRVVKEMIGLAAAMQGEELFGVIEKLENILAIGSLNLKTEQKVHEFIRSASAPQRLTRNEKRAHQRFMAKVIRTAEAA